MMACASLNILSGSQQQLRPEFSGHCGVPPNPYYYQDVGQAPGLEQQFQRPVMQASDNEIDLKFQRMEDAMAALHIQLMRKRDDSATEAMNKLRPLSEEIYNTWDRGDKTDLYNKIENIK